MNCKVNASFSTCEWLSPSAGTSGPNHRTPFCPSRCGSVRRPCPFHVKQSADRVGSKPVRALSGYARLTARLATRPAHGAPKGIAGTKHNHLARHGSFAPPECAEVTISRSHYDAYDSHALGSRTSCDESSPRLDRAVSRETALNPTFGRKMTSCERGPVGLALSRRASCVRNAVDIRHKPSRRR